MIKKNSAHFYRKNKKITISFEFRKFNVTDLTITEGRLTSNNGRPATPDVASEVDYVLNTTPLTSLIVKGENIVIEGKAYPLLMRGTALIQIDGSVKLGTSIIASGFDTKSYLTGTITVTEKIAIASAGKAAFKGSTPSFDHSEFTATGWGTIMKGAKIIIEAGDFFAVTAIKGVDGTSNTIDAEGTFYVSSTVPTVADDNIQVSGMTDTTIPTPLSDK